ncbi:hypothetical protein KKG61_06990 [bacterium]|nr:hypothetical protein [bacterium]
MKKTFVMKQGVKILGVLLVSLLIPWQMVFGDQDNKVVNLNVELKKPEEIYLHTQTGWVFGPLIGCQYASSSPIRWKEDVPELKSTAITCTLINVSAVAVGTWMMMTAYSYDTTEFSPGKFMLGIGLMSAVPTIVNHFCGDRFARWAVERNKKIYKQFGYEEIPF